MKKIIIFLALVFAMILSDQSQAYQSGHWRSGIGYYSENVLSEVANKNTGEKGFLGTANYPIIVSYDWAMTQSWFLAPSFNYTALPRDTKGSTAKVSILHILFPFGKNAGPFDWSVGPGFLRETIKGGGGTVTMNNGTGSATFGKPGREVSVQKITFDIGGGFNSGKLRYGLDLMFIAPLSSKERTQNLMFSITYDFSGGSPNSGGDGMFQWSR